MATKKARLQRVAAFLAVLICFFSMNLNSAAYTYVPEIPGSTLLEQYTDDASVHDSEPFFSEVYAKWQAQGIQDATGEEITVDLGTIKTAKGDMALKDNLFDGQTAPVVDWSDEELEWVEFQVSVPSAGLYHLTAEYHLYEQKVPRASERSIQINGEIPFSEANSIRFNRYFKDAAEPKVNALGDEIKPPQEEIKGWYQTTFYDSIGYYSDPLRFYFKEGVNTIRFTFSEGKLALSSLKLTIPKSYQDYDTYLQEKKADHSLQQDPLSVEQIEIQAESNTVWKNGNSLSRGYSGDAACVPRAVGNRLLNVMGGGVWKDGGQTITWRFDVKQAGYYKIALRYFNSANNGIAAYRTIRLDGEVPFSEMLEYSFPYSTKWQSETLGKGKDDPYLFYLSEGEHTFSMTVTLGALTEMLQSSYYDMMEFARIYRSITKITTSNPDPNYEYYLTDKIPGLLDQISAIKEKIEQKSEYIAQMGSQEPSMINNLTYIVERLEKMIKKPNDISRRIPV